MTLLRKYIDSQRLIMMLSLSLLLFGYIKPLSAQGFLHRDGKNIVDGDGRNIILRGIGTGNWLLQEGYMMKSAGVAGTQHEFREKLIETIGLERTDEFYESWLSNHFRRVDVDSMAAWGFNSVRMAMHYKWYTLPIEEEPLQGQNTWLEKGFEITDSLLSWCADNQMYLILDLHGAPGGQGKNADISDYDKNKPSLWENEFNRSKTVALWRKLAERYSDHPWIGGYDLINEVNWTLPDNNAALRDLYIRITDTIREVDRNHIIFIEGNDFANNFSGLTPPWEDNMVYSFHKYWTYNDDSSLDWVIRLRDDYNIPLWLGESGENSNVWFTNLVRLCENKNIGWSWWPVKKAGINNVLEVESDPQYLKMIDMWRGGSTISAEDSYRAVMRWSENHRIENCKIKYDVIDALIRQPHTRETKFYMAKSTNERIYSVDFDLGRNNSAYFDTDTMNCHFSNPNDTLWNIGWAYRNDAVDIQDLVDPAGGNGYYVGWTKKGEWLQYTIINDIESAYRLRLVTSGTDDGLMHIEVNGRIASENTVTQATGGWYNWGENYINDVIIPEGEVRIKLVFDADGTNLNYFEFTDPKPVDEIPFQIISAVTDLTKNKIYVNLNKEMINAPGSISLAAFQLIVNHGLTPISVISINEANTQQLIIETEKNLFSVDDIKLSYRGESIIAQNQILNEFTGFTVDNTIPPHFEIPGMIEAEDFFNNNGFRVQDCDDIGGGENTGYADDGDYLDYLIFVAKEGDYKVDFRVAAESGTPEILVMHDMSGRMVPIKAIKFNSTGGWQNWRTQSSVLSMPAGKMVFRIYSRSGKHNLNWFEFNSLTGIQDIPGETGIIIYPNPAKDSVKLDFQNARKREIGLFDIGGQKLFSKTVFDSSTVVDTSFLPLGNYIVTILEKGLSQSFKLQIIK